MRTHLLLVSMLALAGCKESKDSKPSTAEAKPVEKKQELADGKAEVEFFGQWGTGEVASTKNIFVAQAEPCTPVPEKPTRYGEATLDKPGPLFAEFYIPQGTVG